LTWPYVLNILLRKKKERRKIEDISTVRSHTEISGVGRAAKTLLGVIQRQERSSEKILTERAALDGRRLDATRQAWRIMREGRTSLTTFLNRLKANTKGLRHGKRILTGSVPQGCVGRDRGKKNKKGNDYCGGRSSFWFGGGDLSAQRQRPTATAHQRK